MTTIERFPRRVSLEKHQTQSWSWSIGSAPAWFSNSVPVGRILPKHNCTRSRSMCRVAAAQASYSRLESVAQVCPFDLIIFLFFFTQDVRWIGVITLARHGDIGAPYCISPLTVWPDRAGPKADEAGPEGSPKGGLSGHHLCRTRWPDLRGWGVLFRTLFTSFWSSSLRLYSESVYTVRGWTLLENAGSSNIYIYIICPKLAILLEIFTCK